jgi:hypothetical protein
MSQFYLVVTVVLSAAFIIPTGYIVIAAGKRYR